MTPTNSEKLEERKWLIAQLEAWPERIDHSRTTNIEYLMKRAAAHLRTRIEPKE